MTPNDFVYWLQGFIEVAKPESLSKEQLTIVREHLDLVFVAATKTAKERVKQINLTEIGVVTRTC